mmetsp:Transcript_32721/g.43627  ORF Transcript_32721/g.43627 Transcript_32721/m.43627 type:complete len:95 (-) Transcript_32721:412-696(-)
MSYDEENWTTEEAIEWEKDLNGWMAKKKCAHCGSNKVPKKLRGRPYMPYVYWHRKKSEELGWNTLQLMGCIVYANDKPIQDTCNECKENASNDS